MNTGPVTNTKGTARFLLPTGAGRSHDPLWKQFGQWLVKTWMGRVLLVAIASWAVYEATGFDAVLPWRIALVVSLIVGVLKLTPRVWRAVFYRVRSKLTIAYLLTAVLPLVLGLALVVTAGMFLLSVFASRMVTNEIERHEAVLSAEARSIVQRVEAGEAAAWASAGLGALENIHSRPTLTVVKDGRVVTSTGGARSTVPTWIQKDEFSGLVRDGDRYFLRAVQRRGGSAVILDVPFDSSLFERLKRESGINVRSVNTAFRRDRRGVRIGRSGGAEATAGGDTTSLKPSPPPPTQGTPVRTEVAASGGLTTGAASEPWNSFVALPAQFAWDTGAKANAAVVFEFDRQLLLKSLTPGDQPLSQYLLIILAVLAAIFAVVYLVAFLFGAGLARSITAAVHALSVGTRKLSGGDFSHRIRVRSRDQLGELATSFNAMAQGIEDLLEQQAEKERLEEDLRVAHDLQMNLLPRHDVTLAGVHIAAVCLPAAEMGGDYYDLLPLDRVGEKLGVLIADVSGKGPSAALYMAELKGLVLSLSRIHLSPRALLQDLNEILSPNLDSKSFVTMTYAVIDSKARTMRFARAGHNPLVHLSGANGTARLLAPPGLALGLDRGETFARVLQEEEIPLVEGDVFVFYTDGVSETMNSRMELFGEARLTEIISGSSSLTSEELKEKVLAEVRQFAAGESPHDDMTMVIVKVAGHPGGPSARPS